MPGFVVGGTFCLECRRNIPYKSKCAPALGTHELHDLAVVPVLVIGHQQPLELRYMALGNDDQALPFGDHVVVSENHRCPLVAIVENLSFHAIQAQPDSGVHRVSAVRKNGIDVLFYAGFDGQGRNIAGAADGNRHTPDPAAVGIEALVDQLGDGRGCNNP